MSRTILFTIICIVIIAVAELGALVTTVTPAQATTAQLWLFFGCTLVILSTFLAPIWYSLKKAVLSQRMKVSPLASLRQTTLFSLVIVLSFFFNSLKLLTVWDVIPLCISMVLIEFFFQADKFRPTSTNVTPE
jgi:hypothetical protein